MNSGECESTVEPLVKCSLQLQLLISSVQDLFWQYKCLFANEELLNSNLGRKVPMPRVWYCIDKDTGLTFIEG